MGSTSSTSIDQNSQRQRHSNSHSNVNTATTPVPTTTTNTPAPPESAVPSNSTSLSASPSFTPTPIMSATINEDETTDMASTRPTSSPIRGTAPPMDLSDSENAVAQPYRMERTDTLNTVQQNNTDTDVNVVVQTESRVLRQRSNSHELDMALSPAVSNDGTETGNPSSTGATPAAAAASVNASASNNTTTVSATACVTATPPASSNTATASAAVPVPAAVVAATASSTRTPIATFHNTATSSSRKPIKTRSKMNITKDVASLDPPTEMGSATIPCLNPPSEVNNRLDTQVEVRVYPCNNSTSSERKKKFTQFNVKPEGVIIQGTNKNRTAQNDLGAEYANHIGRKLQRYELSDTRACQLLVTTHNKSYWVVPAPEAFSRHSGTCRLLGDRKHQVANHTLQVGDFLRVGSVGVVVIETHNGVENRILSEEKIQKIMKDTTNSNGAFLDLGETDGENSDDSMSQTETKPKSNSTDETPVCYMCFDDENTVENPLITPCKCRGDTRYVHVGCLRKWHTAEADNQICFLSSVDATCSVCKSTFKSDFKLKDGRLVKLFKSSLEPPYVSLLVATKHEMAQRLFNTRFQLSFSTIMKPDGKNATRALQLGRSSGSDMVLDYRTVSARHATIRFKNGEFIFTDAQSSNGSYLYLRRPVELTPSQQVQFRLGRSMISMKVVNKWNRRLKSLVRRSGNSANSNSDDRNGDDHSVGSNEEDVRITDGKSGTFVKNLPRRSRESIIESMPPAGKLHQTSSQHLDLLYALAYPKKSVHRGHDNRRKDSSKKNSVEESKAEEGNEVNNMMAAVSIANARDN